MPYTSNCGSMRDVPRACNVTIITFLTASQICIWPGPASEGSEDLILDLILNFDCKMYQLCISFSQILTGIFFKKPNKQKKNPHNLRNRSFTNSIFFFYQCFIVWHENTSLLLDPLGLSLVSFHTIIYRNVLQMQKLLYIFPLQIFFYPTFFQKSCHWSLSHVGSGAEAALLQSEMTISRSAFSLKGVSKMRLKYQTAAVYTLHQPVPK